MRVAVRIRVGVVIISPVVGGAIQERSRDGIPFIIQHSIIIKPHGRIAVRTIVDDPAHVG